MFTVMLCIIAKMVNNQNIQQWSTGQIDYSISDSEIFL